MTPPGPTSGSTANAFRNKGGELHVESVPASRIAARYGTPTYVYSHAAITAALASFQQAFAGRDHLICYAVKANSNIAILQLMAQLGCGFDIVSGGELTRVLRAGGDPAKTVFSGVGKTADEMRLALEAGIHCFNLESESELEVLAATAKSVQITANISVRVNPDVNASTHPYIATGLRENKFGVSPEDALDMYLQAQRLPYIEITGLDCHIGSQILEVGPFAEALAKLLPLVDELASRGIDIAHLDLGGGLGVRYADESPASVDEYAAAIIQTLGHRGQRLVFEPGRFLIANAGILITEVLYLKQGEDRRFAVIDAAMNDLIRPALYQSWQEVVNTRESDAGSAVYDIVGPVCETGDFLARGRELAVAEGDLLAICSVGAYGMVMSSNYNSRNRAAEILVAGDQTHLIRERETIDHQLSLEHLVAPRD